MRGLIALLLAVATLLVLPALTCAQEAGDEWTEPITGMEFVWVPGGCYEMGCGEWAGDDCDEDEYPAHEVCVDGFWMGKYEVTQGQWNAVMEPTSSETQEQYVYPATRINWDEANRFIRRIQIRTLFLLDFRLPVEAEWEYACRSGGLEEIYAGNNNPDPVAWYESNSRGVHPIGTKDPNRLGLYDMSGNVWEWVQDWYRSDAYGYNQAQYDFEPSRVMRGGSWYFCEIFIRCGYRGAAPQNNNGYQTGFRIVISNTK